MDGIHINSPEIISRIPLPDETIWCFGCRKRTTYKRELIVQEWYDPTEIKKCSVCGEDRSVFGE